MIRPNERYRVKRGQFASDASYGNNGVFIIPHFKIAGYFINCIVSDGGGWEHVSVTISSENRNVERCPTWEEMCFIKGEFWGEDECVLQFHPPASEYVNNHKYCLHLWKPIGLTIQLPNSIMVGYK